MARFKHLFNFPGTLAALIFGATLFWFSLAKAQEASPINGPQPVMDGSVPPQPVFQSAMPPAPPPPEMPPPPPPPMSYDRPADPFQGQQSASSGVSNSTTRVVQKLRLMKRVPGPECSPESWQRGRWYKGSHEHTFGWWWIVGDIWYNIEKKNSRIPEYGQRSIIVYKDDAKDKAPLPASIKLKK